jgi:hypothetical protein
MTDPAAIPLRFPTELSDSLRHSAMALDIYGWLAQRLPRIEGQESGLTPETRAQKAEMASLAQQQRQLADQLATTRESSGRQEAGQSSEQDVMASATAAAANWTLVFDDDPVPPAATVVPIRWSDLMFGDVGGRPTGGTVH